MKEFWEFAKIGLYVFCFLTALLLILLSLPHSKLRNVFLKVYGNTLYAITGLLVLYIINPIDLLPDIIPLVGQLDDSAGALGAIFTGLTGWMVRKQVIPINE